MVSGWAPARVRRRGAPDRDTAAVHGRHRRERVAPSHQPVLRRAQLVGDRDDRVPWGMPGAGTGVYTIRPNGSRLRHVLNNRYWPPTYPDWSPDGTQLAYTGAVSDAESDIYVSNANGRRTRQLTHHGGAQPGWSPNGKYIAFVGHNGLYVIRRDGRSLRRIVSIPPHPLTSTKWLVISSPSWQTLPR